MKTRTPVSRTSARGRADVGDGTLIAATQFVATVITLAEGRFGIRSAALETEGRRAASCLLEPMPGDSVVCVKVAPHEIWIIAVLQREGDATHVLRTQGPARLESSTGSLTLDATELAIHSESVRLRARRADVAADDVALTGGQMRLIGGRVKVIGEMLSTVFDRVNHFSKQHTRTTAGLDRLRAAQLDCEAEQLMSLSGEHVLVQGEKLVKTRGGQIHFG